jgi:Ras-related protein Rab-7A
MNRYSTGKFTGQYKATIGADFLTKQNVIVTDSYAQRHLATLQIWDTAGQERFQSLGVGFYRGADACLLVYDITDPHSLDNLDHWRKEFLSQVGGGLQGLSDSSAAFPFVVLGNKMDKGQDRLVPQDAAEEWCQRAAGATIMGSDPLPHFETSAKTSESVDDAFLEAAKRALAYEDYKKRSQPQLFVPPAHQPIDLRYQSDYMNEPGCC